MTEPLLTSLKDESDLCRNEGATDIANLLDEAVKEIERLGRELAERTREREMVMNENKAWGLAVNDYRARIAAATEYAEGLRKALALLVEDVQQYEAWQRPCHALTKATEALAVHSQGRALPEPQPDGSVLHVDTATGNYAPTPTLCRHCGQPRERHHLGTQSRFVGACPISPVNWNDSWFHPTNTWEAA